MSVSLSDWREQSLFTFDLRRREYLTHLASVTSFEAEMLKAVLTRALAGEVNAQLQVAAAISDLGSRQSDLAMTWLTVVASRQSYESAAIAGRIALGAELWRLGRCSKDAQERRRFARLASDALDPLCEVFSRKINIADLLQDAANTFAVQRPEEPTASEADPPLPLGAPTLVIAEKPIPSSGRADDRALAKTWAFLNAPLPLACAPDPDILEAVLTAEFPWMSAAISAVVDDLRLRLMAGQPEARWRPLLLVGPPSAGKSLFARRVATLVGSGYLEVNLGGASDNRYLAGTAKGWATSTPCAPLLAVQMSGKANPILLLEEIDKCEAGGRNGDPRATLLGMIEPVTAKTWVDEALGVPVNLSAVNWIATANSISRLRGPLLTRLRAVEVKAPGAEHVETILANMRRDIATSLQLMPEDIPNLDDAAFACFARALEKGISMRRIRAAYEKAILMSMPVRTAIQ